ncbi:hypothetical protein FRC19_003102 [Serendipita sp. 401]|nr:hypothetical protein FRC15_004368 [Serendipita sp. 397]KAG8777515.1 hypothetical protein FRC16_004129 [Serendipita sp. 398]KAG8812476.1 hypothetical protein FRC19_003102 [Serendipita sp. 401]KAG8842632.1 hypothetical protein FRC20_004323 [Serendipita sp. 405]
MATPVDPSSNPYSLYAEIRTHLTKLPIRTRVTVRLKVTLLDEELGVHNTDDPDNGNRHHSDHHSPVDVEGVGRRSLRLNGDKQGSSRQVYTTYMIHVHVCRRIFEFDFFLFLWQMQLCHWSGYIGCQ